MRWPLPGHAPPGRPVPGGEEGVGPLEEAVVAGGQAEVQPGEGAQCPGHAAVAGTAGGGPRGHEEAPASCPGAGPGEEEGPRGQEAAAAEEEEGAGEGLVAGKGRPGAVEGGGERRGMKDGEGETRAGRPPGPTAPWGTQPRHLSACLELLWGLEKKGFCGVGPAGGGGWVNLNMFWAPSDGLW